MIQFHRAERADDGGVLAQPFCHLRHQLADVDSRNTGLDGLKRTAGVGAGLGIPRLELAGTAAEEDEDRMFLILLQLLDHGRGSERVQAQSTACEHPGHRAEKGSPTQVVVGCATRLEKAAPPHFKTMHWNIHFTVPFVKAVR